MENNVKQENISDPQLEKTGAKKSNYLIKFVLFVVIGIVIFIIAGITFFITASIVSQFQTGYGVGALGNLVEIFAYSAVSAIISIILSIIFFVRKIKNNQRERK